jgi:uncharacterized membrane protein YfcA
MPQLDATQYALLALAGLVAGAVNAIAGGGSLISFPALLAVGYPALSANVTNTVALVPGYLGGSMAYRPELTGQRARIRTLGTVSLIGGLVGAILLVISPGSVFRAIVPWLILFACALLLAQPAIARLVGNQEGEGERHPVILLTAQFLAAIYGGYFGAGLGVMMLAVLGIFLHDTLQRLNALKGLLSLIINLISAIYFALFGPVAWVPVLIMAAASMAGGHLGVYIARRLSNTVLRALVVVFGVAVAIRLLM